MIPALSVAAALLALVLLLLLGGKPSEGGKARREGKEGPRNPAEGQRWEAAEPRAKAEGRIAPRSCPLCASRLGPGERVKSDLSPGRGDRIMRIFGCPHCWPALPGQESRICPVCGRPIPSEGHALARYFERPGRKHVHVLGCTGCRSPLGSVNHGR